MAHDPFGTEGPVDEDRSELLAAFDDVPDPMKLQRGRDRRYERAVQSLEVSLQVLKGPQDVRRNYGGGEQPENCTQENDVVFVLTCEQPVKYPLPAL